MRLARLVALCILVLFGTLLPSAARAGSYEVVSCAAAGGVNHAWQSFNEDPSTLVVTDSCASVGGGPEDGLSAVDRIPGPPHTPKDRATGWRLTAPAGLRVTRFTTQRYLGQRSAGEWFPYLKTTGGTTLDTCTIPMGGDHCERGEPTYDPFGPVASFAADAAGLEVGVRCAEVAGTCGNGGLQHAAWVALYSTRVQITDAVPPSIPQPAPAPPGSPPGYARGTFTATVSATDLTGIRRTQLLVDDVPHSTRERACDYTYVIPCSSEPGAAHELDTRALADGTHAIAEVAEDAAGNQASTMFSLTTDNTAPAAPLDVRVQHPADASSTSRSSELSWRNPPGQLAPITAAHWALCRGDLKGVCLTGSRQAILDGEHGRTGSLSPLENGEWQAYLWLEDAAGNVDPAHAAGPVPLVVTGSGLKSPRLKVLRVRRLGNRLSVKGTASAKTGRVRVSVERRLRGRTHRVTGRATIRNGRWTKRLRLRGRLAEVRRTTLVVRFTAKNGYKAQTLRRRVHP